MYRKCFVLLLLNILFANHLVSQVNTNKIILKNRLFFYSGASQAMYGIYRTPLALLPE